MARGAGAIAIGSNRFPHPRGDGPRICRMVSNARAISPPTWGWPGYVVYRQHHRSDFPTHVGMARAASRTSAAPRRFPHPRGDGPSSRTRLHAWRPISPPTWGWPVHALARFRQASDFPTHVGMARAGAGGRAFPLGFPHPRGDGPSDLCTSTQSSSISPPTWGWPGFTLCNPVANLDFPTHVGMARRRRNLSTPLL